MGGPSETVEFSEFHRSCQRTIEEINSRYPENPNLFSMFGLIKAKSELEELVNSKARALGFEYDLSGEVRLIVPEIIFKTTRNKTV